MKALAQNTLIQNRYLIVQLIGKGGMGEVYLAVDQRLGSAVALKRTYFAGDEMLGNAFEREARTLARMRHPVLPKVSDHFAENGEQFLVMEHISGEDLAKRLEAAQKPFPISWVLFWADQLLDALAYLHSHEPPIIHRDIKPQNLKLTDENNIILLDFGLSKTSTGQTNISQSGSTGSVVGYTPHYAPMEQIRGIGTTARSDIYSLSATLYQLLSNTVPPDALTRADVMLNGQPDPVRLLKEINPDVSANVSDVIMKGMEVSQEKRFAEAREMQKMLRRAFTEMQEATSAGSAAISSKAPNADKTHAKQRGADAKTKIEEQSRYKSAPATPADLEATIAIGPADVIEPPKQSDIKTEVFLAGSLPVEANGENPVAASADPVNGSSSLTPQQKSSELPVEEYSRPVAKAEFVPDETMPIINLDRDISVASAAAPEAISAETGAPGIPPPSEKAAGKPLLILGGLAAFFILAIGAVIVGLYLYTRTDDGISESQATPTPLATIEATPSPEPSLEAATNVNSADSATAVASPENANVANADSALTVEPTPAEEVAETDAADSGQRPAQSSGAGTSAARPRGSRQQPSGAPAPPRAAQKPKSPTDRIRILQ